MCQTNTIILYRGLKPTQSEFVKLTPKVNKHDLEESYEDFPLEKNHTKFCKFLIGANKYSSNGACKSEVGRYPLAISATLLLIK